jgi:hypothetical protein
MTHRSVAFLVSVDRFSDAAFTPLRFCQNDVDGMARVLRNTEIGGFEIVEVRNKRHDEVLESLERNVASLVPGDRLLFYFAGHGRRSPQSGRLYLVATNTKSDALRATGIPIDNALDIIRESRCDNRALVLDCCHSGAVGEGFRGVADLASGLNDLARRNSGTSILTASTAIQLAAERESAANDGASGNGIFTKYFIEALENGAASSGDSDDITIDAVYDYIQQRVTVQASQQPQRFVIGGAGRFVVGRSSAGLWERRRGELGKRCIELNHQNVISDDDYMAAAKIFRAPWAALTSDQKVSARVGLDMLDGKTSVSQFCFRPGAPSEQESKPSVARLPAAASLGAAIGFVASSQTWEMIEFSEWWTDRYFVILLVACTVFGAVAGVLCNQVNMIVAAMLPGAALSIAWAVLFFIDCSRSENLIDSLSFSLWQLFVRYPIRTLFIGLSVAVCTYVAFILVKFWARGLVWRRTRKIAQ